MQDIIENQLQYPKTTDFGANPGAYKVPNVLDEIAKSYASGEDFFNEVNKPFLDEAISRGDEIAIATQPGPETLFNDQGNLMGFGREIEYLGKQGYHYDPVIGKWSSSYDPSLR